MITVIEWRDVDGEHNLLTAMEFTNRPEQFIHFAREALSYSDEQCHTPMIAVTIFDNNGDLFDADCFDTAKKADKWWTEKCFN